MPNQMIKIVIVSALCLMGVSCTPRALNPTPIQVHIPSEQAREAIREALAIKDWKIVFDKPGSITAKQLFGGRHLIVIKIVYDDREVAIRYADSQNLKYKHNDGEPTIHKAYFKRVDALQEMLKMELRVQNSGSR